MTNYAAKHGLGAKVLFVQAQKDNLQVTMTRYPMTLGEYIELYKTVPEDLKNLVLLQINNLHAVGVVHGDLHEHNIVIDLDQEDPKEMVKIIDYGESFFINEWSDERRERLYYILDPDFEFENVDLVLEYEQELFDRLKTEGKL